MWRLAAVSGCSGPSTFSRIASARSKSGRAPARSPWAWSRLSEVVEARAVSGCSGTEHFLADRQRAFQERPRPGKVTLGLEQPSEVVQAPCRIGMLGSRAPSRGSPARVPRAAVPPRGRPRPGVARPRLLRLSAVSGCSGPCTFSRIASARSKSGLAPVRSPWAGGGSQGH